MPSHLGSYTLKAVSLVCGTSGNHDGDLGLAMAQRPTRLFLATQHGQRSVKGQRFNVQRKGLPVQIFFNGSRCEALAILHF